MINQEGELDLEIGNFQKAQTAFNSALNICLQFENIENYKIFTDVLVNFGNLHLQMGNLIEAETFYWKSLQIKANVDPEAVVSIAYAYNYLGLLYQKKGELNKAKKFLLKSSNIIKKTYGENHISTANYVIIWDLYFKLWEISLKQKSFF